MFPLPIRLMMRVQAVAPMVQRMMSWMMSWMMHGEDKKIKAGRSLEEINKVRGRVGVGVGVRARVRPTEWVGRPIHQVPPLLRNVYLTAGKTEVTNSGPVHSRRPLYTHLHALKHDALREQAAPIVKGFEGCADEPPQPLPEALSWAAASSNAAIATTFAFAAAEAEMMAECFVSPALKTHMESWVSKWDCSKTTPTKAWLDSEVGWALCCLSLLLLSLSRSLSSLAGLVCVA